MPRAVFTPRAKKPESVSVKPRNVSFGLEDGLPRYWVDGDPFLTHFMNALSVIFPPGERMFMDAVRAVRDQVQNPETRRDITGFLAQEALHSREHSALNTALAKFGYPVLELEQGLKEGIKERESRRDKRTSLAVTAALEHVTAILGHKLLTQPELQALADEKVLPLWLWHAIEEMEHKAVAFDAYQEVYGDYLPRVMALLFTTIGLFATAHWFQYYLLKRDGLADKPSIWLKGLVQVWGSKVKLYDLAPAWLAYFHPNFHPWQQDDSSLIEAYKKRFVEAKAA
ncbi:MAG: metal-dependent hydrolase [Myxococcales bacterium]